jgi:hypothetical protein
MVGGSHTESEGVGRGPPTPAARTSGAAGAPDAGNFGGSGSELITPELLSAITAAQRSLDAVRAPGFSTWARRSGFFAATSQPEVITGSGTGGTAEVCGTSAVLHDRVRVAQSPVPLPVTQ